MPTTLKGRQVEQFTSTLDGVVPASGPDPNAFLRADGAWTTPPPIQFTTIEKNLGVSGKYSGEFDIIGTGFTVGRPLLIVQAAAPYTGKGNLADEGSDTLVCNGYVVDSTTMRVYWQATESPLAGNVKFQYAIL